MGTNLTEYKRNCEQCGKEIVYTGKYAKYTYNRTKNRLCRRCFSSGERNSFYGKTHSLRNKKLFSENAKRLHTGRKRTDETKKRISVGIKNSNHAEIMKSKEMRRRLSISNSISSKKLWLDSEYREKTLQGRIGYKHSKEVKERMRISRIAWMKTHQQYIQSKSATKFLDSLETVWRQKIEREFELDSRFFDGRIGNLLIEVDGKYWHSTKKQKNVDEQKNEIAKKNGFLLLRVEVNSKKDIENALNKILRGEIQ